MRQRAVPSSGHQTKLGGWIHQIGVNIEVVTTEAALVPQKPPLRKPSWNQLKQELNRATKSSEDNGSEEFSPEAATCHSAAASEPLLPF